MKGRKTTGRHFKHSSQATESIKSPFFCPAKNSSIFIVAPKIMTSILVFHSLKVTPVLALKKYMSGDVSCIVFVKICADLGEF